MGIIYPFKDSSDTKTLEKTRHLDVNTSNYRDILSVYYLVCSLSNKEKQLLGSTCNPADVG